MSDLVGNPEDRFSHDAALLLQIWINDSTNKISKIVVWKDSAWRNYHPSGIAVNPYNVDPMYDAIALYVMNLY